ncbi:MAG: DUF1016 domain-containing protein [Selenomonas ruminantium]|nr:DUF1016 domain-containing protein [Selenomonas ruminantium]
MRRSLVSGDIAYAKLKNMRQFYRAFQNRYTLCSDLSWSHYRNLMRVADSAARISMPPSICLTCLLKKS